MKKELKKKIEKAVKHSVKKYGKTYKMLAEYDQKTEVEKALEMANLEVKQWQKFKALCLRRLSLINEYVKKR